MVHEIVAMASREDEFVGDNGDRGLVCLNPDLFTGFMDVTSVEDGVLNVIGRAELLKRECEDFGRREDRRIAPETAADADVEFRWSACGIEVEPNGTVGYSPLVAKVYRYSTILDSLQRKHSLGDNISGSMGTSSPYIDVLEVRSFAGSFARPLETGLSCRHFIPGSEQSQKQFFACVVLLCFRQRYMILRWLTEP